MKRLVLIGTERTSAVIQYETKRQLLRELATYDRLYGKHSNTLNIGGLFRKQAPAVSPMAGGYAAQVKPQNGDAAFDTSAELDDIADIAAGASVRYWEKTIPPRYMYVWGSGMKGLINNQGYLYFWILDTGTDIQLDEVRLGVESYDKRRYEPVFSFQDDATNLGVNTNAATMTPTNNQTKMLALPETTVIALPYSRLVIDITCLVAATDPDLVDFSIPVTVKSQ